MKRLIFTTATVFLFVSTLTAFHILAADRVVTVDKMPEKAKQFIAEYFKSKQVAYANWDKELFDGSYSVGFTDGSKVEFDSKGEWKDVECLKSTVPDAIVPAKIKAYVAQHYRGVRVEEIERDKDEYDVKLSNRFSLAFDSKCNLIDIDAQN